MNTARTPLLLVAIALSVVVVALELGSPILRGVPLGTDARLQRLQSEMSGELLETFQGLDAAELRARLSTDAEPPGIGIAFLALVDVILAHSLVLIGLGLVLPERIQGKLQGPVTGVLALLLILGSIVGAFATFGQIMLMVTLLLAVPFGTIAYMVKFGFFDTGAAAGVLSLLMACKLGIAGLLIAANPRYLENRGLVILILLSLVLTIVLALLHGIPPGFLVSITDAVGALIFAILAAVWGIMLAIGALGSILRAVRVDRELAS